MSVEVVIEAERRKANRLLAEDPKALRFMAREAFYAQRHLDSPTDDGRTFLDNITDRAMEGLEGEFSQLRENEKDKKEIGVLQDHLLDFATLHGSLDPDIQKHLSSKIEGRKSAIQRLEMHGVDFDAAERVLNAVTERRVSLAVPLQEGDLQAGSPRRK